MANLVEALVAKTFKEFSLVTQKPENRLKLQRDDKLASKLKGSVKDMYDFTQMYDKMYTSDVVPELIVDDFDDEQIWQQLEIQNEAATKGLLDCLATTNLTETKLSFDSQSHSKKTMASSESKTKDAVESSEDEGEMNGGDNSLKSVEDESESDTEMQQIKKRLARLEKGGDDSLFEGLGSDDEDLFKDSDDNEDDNGIQSGAKDDGEDEDDDLDFDFELSKYDKPKSSLAKDDKSEKRKRKTEVDDKFFKLADMEEFLEREDAREEKKQRRAARAGTGEAEESSESEEDEDEIDMFTELPEDEVEEGAMYNDFFDPPDDEDQTEGPHGEKKKKQKDGHINADDGSDAEEDDSDNEFEVASDDDTAPAKKKMKVHFSEDTKGQDLLSSESEGEDVRDVLDRGKASADSLSTFEKRQEKLKRQIAALEDASLEAKPWQLSGEASADMRPENSLLEEHVMFDHTSCSAPEITEETTKTLEDIIKQRIKDKSWDDVVRKERVKEEPYEFKKRIQLDQEKSKMSLSQLYEQEYLKQQTEEEEEKTNPKHEMIKKMMDSLFRKLDALSSFHYTPKPAAPEVKIISNMPSIAMEEATPVAVSDAALLAPEEVKAKTKGELKGKAERTDTDKKRERRLKKAAKRERQREKEKRQKAVEKVNPGLGNKYSKERAMRELEKQSKTGANIEVVKGKKEKSLKSSKNFFSQLQEEVTTHVRSKMAAGKKEKKQKSSKNYLL